MPDTGRGFRDVLTSLGRRAQQVRLIRNMTQAELAKRAALSTRTIERFEKTGTASLENVLRIASALHVEAAFDTLFEPPAYTSIDEALSRPAPARRKRASRRS